MENSNPSPGKMPNFIPIGMCGYGLPERTKNSIMGIIINKELDEYGLPIVDFHFSDLYRFYVKALLDTGAAINLIDPSVALALELKSISKQGVDHLIMGKSVQGVYTVNFRVDNFDRIFTSEFTAMPALHSHCDMILGTPFFKLCKEFRYLGTQNRFELIID